MVRRPLPLLLTGTRRGNLEADPAPVGLADPVEPLPVLPALTLGNRLVLDDPGAGLALASLHQADPLHQLDQDGLVDLLPRVGGFEQQVGESREVGLRGVTVKAVEADRAGRGELGPEILVVQEDRLLHERDNAADVRGVVHSLLADPGAELVLELAGKVLGLTARQLEWGVLGAFAVAQPGVVVAAEAPGVPLQFHQVEPSAGQARADRLRASVLGRRGTRSWTRPGMAAGWEDLPDQAESLRLMLNWDGETSIQRSSVGGGTVLHPSRPEANHPNWVAWAFRAWLRLNHLSKGQRTALWSPIVDKVELCQRSSRPSDVCQG